MVGKEHLLVGEPEQGPPGVHGEAGPQSQPPLEQSTSRTLELVARITAPEASLVPSTWLGFVYTRSCTRRVPGRGVRFMGGEEGGPGACWGDRQGS